MLADVEQEIMADEDSMPLLPPSVIKEVEDCCVNEGGAGKFVCDISGNPTPSICWYRNDEKLKENRNYSMFVEYDERHTLIITHSNVDFAGSYTCEATNSEGSVKSTANLLVTIHDHDHDHEEHEDDIELCDSENLIEKPDVEIQKENVKDYFMLLEELGRGKYGVVHKCVEKATNHEYCAKFLKCRPSQKKAILNEIDIMNSLHHKLIINLIAAFEFSRQIVLVLELVSGGELVERLMEEELISEMDVTFYVKQVLCAIKHMHDTGILHLDLKPENIMLVNRNSTQIKLIDFGLARKISQSNSERVLCGTPEFISPEVINYEPVSRATDMWSIGVITYLLLSGSSPFAGDTDPETLANVTRSEYNFYDEVFDDISEEAKDFISQLLINKPRSRSSCDECLKHPWLKVKIATKKIRTAYLASFIARRNWKKSITAVRATNFLSKIASSGSMEKASSSSIDENDHDSNEQPL